MLSLLKRNLFSLLSIAVVASGCGKKIEESAETASSLTENQEMPSAYILRLDGSQESRKSFFIPRSAQFEVPERLKVRKGETWNKVVEIVYDLNEQDSNDFQFKCAYKASFDPSELILYQCVDDDGNDFGEVTNHRFTLRTNDIIQMRFTGAPAKNLIVEAIYNMNWI